MQYRKRIRTISFLPTMGLFLLASAVLQGCGSGMANPLPLGVLVNSSGNAVGNSSLSSSNSSRAGCTDSTYSPNFANGIDPASGLPNRLYHWDRFPLNVCFVSSSLATPDRVAQAQAGFNWWVQSTGGMIKFQTVNSASQADVTIYFEEDGMTGYGALTNYTVSGSGVMQKADIHFNMSYLSSVPSITPIAAHEFGHSLGIAGHSDIPTDVMSEDSNVYNLTQLSQRDVNTLLTAYCGVTISARAAAGTQTMKCKIKYQ